MAVPFIGDLIDGVKDLVSEVVVDKDKRNEINLKMRELEDRATDRYHKELMGQIQVNVEEAKHQSLFVAGWRPAVGWIGAGGLGYNFVVQPIAAFAATVGFNYGGRFPELDTEAILYLLGGMLGFGSLRTFEKVKGVSGVPVEQSAVTATPATRDQSIAAKAVVAHDLSEKGEITVTGGGVPYAGTQIAPSVPAKKRRNVFDKIGKLF